MSEGTSCHPRSVCIKTLIPLAGLQLCILLGGCDEGYNSPEPNTLDHHTHMAILHFRTANHTADTLGIVSVTTYDGSLLASRGASPKLSRDFAVPAYLPNPVQFVFPDTMIHACTLEVDHFVGYQTRYGGDTSRFSAMDRYGQWVLELSLQSDRVVFAGGDTAQVVGTRGPYVPDTVRPDVPFELDVTVDLDGLLQWRAATNDYQLQTDHIHVRQR